MKAKIKITPEMRAQLAHAESMTVTIPDQESYMTACAYFADRLIEDHEDKFPGGMGQIQNFAQCVLDELNENLAKGKD